MDWSDIFGSKNTYKRFFEHVNLEQYQIKRYVLFVQNIQEREMKQIF